MPARPALVPAFFGLAVCLLVYGAYRRTRDYTPVFGALRVSTQGVFPPGGEYPGEALPHAAGVRTWGSWGGGDGNTGSLRIGPFAAPARLRFAVGGYPHQAGNQIVVELTATGECRVVDPSDVGERWRAIDVDLPPAWAGRDISVIAIDHSKNLGGWLAISEPLRGGPGDGSAAWVESLAAWLSNGLIFAVLIAGAARVALPWPGVPAHWAPFAAITVVAIAGYAAFWIYFASAPAGKCFSIAGLLAAAWLASRPSPLPRPGQRELLVVAALTFAVGLLYLAVLHLYVSSSDFYTLAANRFRDGLPGDNTLPYNLASELFRGASPRHPGADWLSSDRPPLQSGWQLLAWPFTAALGFSAIAASGTAAVWFQLLWIPAGYGLLRSLGLSSRRAAGWIVPIALTGFFAQNTVFTWPKLSAGAFTVAAFSILVAPRQKTRLRPAAVCFGAACAALGWLSHGGVAFSLLAMTPWTAARILRGEWRCCLLGAAIFLSFSGPWFAYQRWYDPPGNRLLKMHLAGEVANDARSTWTTIHRAYQRLGWNEIMAAKRDNLKLLFDGHPAQLVDFSSATAPLRRHEEFFFLDRALAGWIAGLPLLLLGLASLTVRRALRRHRRGHGLLAAWTVLTVLVWCALMFKDTVVHQGSYAVEITLIALSAAWLELAGAWLLPAFTLYQAAYFATTWAARNQVIHGPVDALALGVAVVVAVVLSLVVVRATRVCRSAAFRAARKPRTAASSPPLAECSRALLEAWTVSRPSPLVVAPSHSAPPAEYRTHRP